MSIEDVEAIPPTMPTNLLPAAAAIWQQLVPPLAAVGKVCIADTLALASYCRMAAMYDKARTAGNRKTMRTLDKSLTEMEGKLLIDSPVRVRLASDTTKTPVGSFYDDNDVEIG